VAATRLVGIVEEDTINADYSLEEMITIYLSDCLLNREFYFSHIMVVCWDVRYV
jgi:hypothetical protein